MNASKNYIFSSVAIFILFLVSMNHWIGWDNRAKYIYALTGLFLWVAYKKEGIKTYLTFNNIWPCIIVFLGYMIYDIGWEGSILSTGLYTNVIYYLVPLSLIICIKPVHKEFILSNISRWFALLMVAALVIYALSLILDLPYVNVLYFSKDNIYSPCKNYIFLTEPLENIDANNHSFLRFQGPFIEPGHLGMMCAFLLFSNKFDFSKRHNIIILVTLLITFSLAGYMLALIGYVLVLFAQKKTWC